jgi:regulator of protease activity HflC (stomatin/prohibitin superfamily)
MVDTKICLGVSGGIIALIVGYLALSFSSLEYNEYGLDYSSIWKEVDTAVYTGGIHFLGFQHSFIKFPKAVQTIEFSDSSSDSRTIESRTSDGLEVNLQISFQYELQAHNLYTLYMHYGEDYKKTMIQVAIDTINKVSNNYTAYGFFLNRTEIGNVMESQMNNVLNSTLYSSIRFFQLKDVDLPDDFENAIQMTEVKKQDIEKAKAEKSKVEVEIETKLQKAQQNVQIILNQAQGQANSITSANQADVKSYNYTEWNIVEGYANLKIEANITNQGLLDYIKSTIIDNYQGDHLVISLD